MSQIFEWCQRWIIFAFDFNSDCDADASNCKLSANASSKWTSSPATHRSQSGKCHLECLRIVSQSGASVMINSQPTGTVHNVKIEAIRKFIAENKLTEGVICDQLQPHKLTEFAKLYKLTRSTGMLLHDQTQVHDARYGDDVNEPWLLVHCGRKRVVSIAAQISDDGLCTDGPTEEDIEAITADLTPTTYPTPAVVNIDDLILQNVVCSRHLVNWRFSRNYSLMFLILL